MEKNRMESLTDGIFAFAMTLLVLNMILPNDAVITQTSSAALFSLLPAFYHYIIAFFVLAAFWMGHHAQFSMIHHIDKNFLFLNAIGLFFVTLVPFSTSFIGDYSSDILATCVFEFNLLILGLILAFQWYYSSHNHRLISPELSQHNIRLRMNRALIIPFISLAAIIITIMGFTSSTMLYMASPLVTYFVMRYTQK
ncbi:MAG: TMEM175 family protein [Methanoregula sp.]|nr:TMEM175 family protein [Methanoregula sp.]